MRLTEQLGLQPLPLDAVLLHDLECSYDEEQQPHEGDDEHNPELTRDLKSKEGDYTGRVFVRHVEEGKDGQKYAEG